MEIRLPISPKHRLNLYYPILQYLHLFILYFCSLKF